MRLVMAMTMGMAKGMAMEIIEMVWMMGIVWVKVAVVMVATTMST